MIIRTSITVLACLLAMGGIADQRSVAEHKSKPVVLLGGLAEDGLLHQCQSSVKMLNRETVSEDEVARLSAMGGYCEGYVEAVADAYMIGGISAMPARPYFYKVCLPGDITRGQVVRLVLRYIENNPKSLSSLSIAVVGAALASAYPCENK